MATLKITGLSKLQANAITMLFEDQDEIIELINDKLTNNDLSPIQLDNIYYDENGDDIITLVNNDEDEDEPGYEPEDCECRAESEAQGIEYEKNFTPSDDKTFWICDNCGRHQ
jgi:hypothetical protein